MTKSAFYQVTDGEWVPVDRKGNLDQCCDCGLVHKINYRITAKNKIEFQVFRNERATAAARKRFKFTKDNDE
jgi:hypothetical protein